MTRRTINVWQVFFLSFPEHPIHQCKPVACFTEFRLPDAGGEAGPAAALYQRPIIANSTTGNSQ